MRTRLIIGIIAVVLLAVGLYLGVCPNVSTATQGASDHSQTTLTILVIAATEPGE